MLVLIIQGAAVPYNQYILSTPQLYREVINRLIKGPTASRLKPVMQFQANSLDISYPWIRILKQLLLATLNIEFEQINSFDFMVPDDIGDSNCSDRCGSAINTLYVIS